MVNSGLEVSNSNRITFATHATVLNYRSHSPNLNPNTGLWRIDPRIPNQLPSISNKSQYRSSMIRLSNPQWNTVHIPQIWILFSMIRLPLPESNTIHIPQIQILLFHHLTTESESNPAQDLGSDDFQTISHTFAKNYCSDKFG